MSLPQRGEGTPVREKGANRGQGHVPLSEYRARGRVDIAEDVALDQGHAHPTVLYVDYSIGFGGSSKSLALTLSGLDDVRPLLVTSQEPELVEKMFGSMRTWRYRRWVNYRTKTHLKSWLKGRGPLVGRGALASFAAADLSVSMVALAHFWWIIKRHHVDLVHVNNPFLPPEAILAAQMIGVPSVVHMRGFLKPPFTSSLLRLARKVDWTISVSDSAVASLKAELPDLRVTTVYDPVDIEAVGAAASRRAEVRASVGAADPDVLVGIFGRVVEWKGHREFLKACIQAMDVDPRLRVLVVGSTSGGPEDYLNELRRIIAQSAHQDRFVLTGYRDDVEGFYSAIDIAVHASISPEPFGMVIPEAMAARRPVIVSDAGGPCEIVTHGKEGLRVPPGNVPALRDAILELSRDPELRSAMGEHGRRTAQARFTVEQNAAAVRSIYRRLLDR